MLILWMKRDGAVRRDPQAPLHLLASFGVRFVMGTLLQVAAAETLFPRGIQPQNAGDLTSIFTGTLGTSRHQLRAGIVGRVFQQLRQRHNGLL